MSGSARGLRPALLRAALAAAEPVYAAAMRLRNALYDRGVSAVRRLPRPVVSVGNITTGGAGKTPVIRWLASRLRDEGRRVAVLSRGYKGRDGGMGDELHMLDRLLNGDPADGSTSRVILKADPDRAAGGAAVLRDDPAVDLFLLDDGFQHRRLARDLDIVLINAADPFGFGRVLPRGLLREPLTGLRRAGAIVLTHADQVDEAGRGEIEKAVRRHNPSAPVYRAVHAHSGFRSAGALAAQPPDHPPGALAGRRWFAFSGIGNPETFVKQLAAARGTCAGSRAFPDHHDYTDQDVRTLKSDAAAAGADLLVTTEKDWVKVAAHAAAAEGPGPPIWRVDVEIRFLDAGGDALLKQVRLCLKTKQ